MYIGSGMRCLDMAGCYTVAIDPLTTFIGA